MNKYKLNETIIDIEFLCVLCLENKSNEDIIKHDLCKEGIVCKKCLIKMKPKDVNECFICRQQTQVFKNYIIKNKPINDVDVAVNTNSIYFCCIKISNVKIINMIDKMIFHVSYCICMNFCLLFILFLCVMYFNAQLDNNSFYTIELAWIIFNCVLVMTFILIYILRFFIIK